MKGDQARIRGEPGTGRGHRRGFSTIEFIGVLAILTILAALAVPVVIRQLDEAMRNREAADLLAMRHALARQILVTKQIPHENQMAEAIAQWTRQPAARIQQNRRGFTRAFLIDTNGWFGTAAGALPYTQATAGSASVPANARVLIVSSISRALPVVTGRPGPVVFNDIWNTAYGAKPSTWGAWAGRGDDLIIERVNLETLFHRLVVVNRDKYGTAPRMSVDTTNTIDVAYGGTGRSGYYLDGSVLGLCDSAGVPVKRLALTNDFGFVFEGGIWRDRISGGDSSEVMAQEFATLAAKFLAAEWYSGATQGGRTGDQQGALNAMYNLMLVFGLWANQFPHFPKHGATATQVPEYVLLDDIVGVGSGVNASGFLNEFTGVNGLLNNTKK